MQIKSKQKRLQKVPRRKFLHITHQFLGSFFLCLIVLATIPRPLPARIEDSSPKVLGVQTVAARGSESIPPPVRPKQLTELNVPKVLAKSFLVYDMASGEVLAEKEGNLQLPIASLTKLLTAYIAYNYLDLQKPIIVSELNSQNIRPVLGLRPGDSVEAKDLLQAMLIGSVNDAAEQLAESVTENAGQIFRDVMNEEAANLGMASSHFSNPVGFDIRGNFSTAQDLAKLIAATQKISLFELVGRITNFNFLSLSGHTYRARATNKLLGKHPDIYAIKTGYTREAVGTMAVKVENKGNPFVIIVLGSPNREADTLALKQSIEQSFVWHFR